MKNIPNFEEGTRSKLRRGSDGHFLRKCLLDE